MNTLTLIQIPFSHNCVKVRVALGLKGVPYETQNVPPSKRAAVFAASGQGMVPVLMDDGRAIPDSTAILLHLEERHGDARIGEVHRDAAAHGPRPDHRRLLDVLGRRVAGHVGNLGRLALREEEVALRLRLG
jgi:glutathione S-transferase